MNRFLSAAILSTAVAAASTQALAAPAPISAAPTASIQTADVQMPVHALVLFSSGVGYFEHLGDVTGDGTAELRFKTSQINDVLKSLLVQDLSGGKVAGVTYPSQDPIAKTLKSFRIDLTENPVLADLLNQLRGARVTIITGNGETLAGTILGVEHRKHQIGEHGDAIETPIINLVTDGGIVSSNLEAVKSVKLDDPELQDELTKALTALASARDTDKKPVRISFTGQGAHQIRVGYVVETPIWKTSYRLILGDPKPTTTQPTAVNATLQGWAIVENQTDNDWKDIQLTLVSGRPISFIEDLYQPLYVPRPVVEPDLFASLRPQTYDGALDDDAKRNPTATPQSGNNFRAERQLGMQLAQDKDALQQREKSRNAAGQFEAITGEQPALQPMNPSASITSLASAGELGELFQYTVGNVSLPRQRSAMIPIITDPIDAERVSIYRESVMPKNPLTGARIHNSTSKHLLAGPLTVIDSSAYAGDAQIDNVPPGQDRLLSYGVDLEMLVDPTDVQNTTNIQTARIVKGVLSITNKQVRSQNYRMENKSDRDKTLIIEQPRQAGWNLVDSAAPMETTDAVYRFRQNMPAGQKASLKITEQIIQGQAMAILSTDDQTLETYRTSGEIPKPVQDALAQVAKLKFAVVDTQRQINHSNEILKSITAEQNRIRENMRTVDKSSDYYTRLMKKLNDQETLIEKTQDDLDGLNKTLASQQNDLDNYLANLNVG